MSTEPSGAVALADDVSDVLYGIAGWLLVWLGLLALLGSAAALVAESGATEAVLAAILFALAAGFVAAGVLVNPRFGRQLSRRHAVTRFGRVRAVDERAIRPGENCTERCVECGSRVDRGLVRRYRDEFAVAGIPAYTYSMGHNHYCLECATAEFAPVADGSAGAGTDGKVDTDADADAVRDRRSGSGSRSAENEERARERT